MPSMIDLHNHLLPGIDDGAPDLETALQMARLAVQDGITHMVCTPHIHPGRYDNDRCSIQQAHQSFSQALTEAGIPLKVSWAAEIRFGTEMMTGLAEGALPFLGQWQGKKVLLLELPHGEFPFGAERLTQWLLDRQVVPMIAHPERNKGLMLNPAKLKPLLQQGCLLQVTAGSLAGRFGPAAQTLARALLEQGLVSILASDAHNLEHRPPMLSEGLEAATRLIGDTQAERLIRDTPWQIAGQHFG